MKDRPRFDVDDTTSSYSPPPAGRPRWVDQGWGAGAAPGGGSDPTVGGREPSGAPHWYDPAWQGGTPRSARGPAPPSGGGRRGPGAIGTGLLAFGAAVAGASLTVGLLAAAGYLVAPAPGPGAAGATTPDATARLTQHVVILEQSAITEAVERIAPAVVTITSRTGDTPPRDSLHLSATVGSGILFDAPRGLVLTGRHVVCRGESFTVTLPDGRAFPATSYGIDMLADLAIVQIRGEDLPAAWMGDSSTLRPGQLAVAIGGAMGTFTTSVTSGVVSAVGRSAEVVDACGDGAAGRVVHHLIQTDATIDRGNSGGPLVDATGRVIGINTPVAGGQSVGFAIPINIARPIMDQASAGKLLTRPWIGVHHEPVTAVLQDLLGLAVDYGVLVRPPADGDIPAVVVDGPAAAAGILDGDLILAVNDERIDAGHPIDELLSQYIAGDDLTLSLMRGDQTLDVRLVLGARPAGLPL